MGAWVSGWVDGRHTQTYKLLSGVVCCKGRIVGFEERKQKHAIIFEAGVVQVFVKLQHKQTQSKTIILMTGWK